MGIDKATSANRISDMQMITAHSAKPESRTIQNKITTVQQKMQKISSKEELSVNEKMDERKKLRKELASLNRKLKQQEDALRSSRKRELLTEKLQKNQEPAKEETPEDKAQAKAISSGPASRKSLPADGQHTDQPGIILLRSRDGLVRLKEGASRAEDPGVNTEKKPADETSEKNGAEKNAKATDNDIITDNNLSAKETHAMVSADASIRQAGRLGTVITRTNDGIVILKGEIAQDEKRSIDTRKKEAELEKLEKAEQRAIAFQFSVLGEADKTLEAATDTNRVTGIRNNTPASAERNAFIHAVNVSQEKQAAQQNFYVSF